MEKTFIIFIIMTISPVYDEKFRELSFARQHDNRFGQYL